MRKFLSIILCAMIILSLMPTIGVSAEASGTCGNNLNWTLDDSGILTISGTGDMWDYNDAWNYHSGIAPWYTERRNIKAIIINDGVTSIGTNAFSGCSNLTYAIIGNGVKSINYYAFYSCTSLIFVNIPDGVTSIGYWAFAQCRSLTSISIPDSVMSIGYEAFRWCENLADISIGNGVTSIGHLAFEVTAFYDNADNWQDGVLYIGNYIIKADESISGAYEIENGIRCIADQAFEMCENLISVSIPESVVSIGEEAFWCCTNLADINIADGVSYIGARAFSKANITTLKIPSSVRLIDVQAFSACRSLITLIISEGVAVINDYAFDFCDGLIDVYYSGSAEQWSNIFIGPNNEYLTNAKIYYDSLIPIPHGKCGDNLTWTLDGNVLSINGAGAMWNWNDYDDVPWHVYRERIEELNIENGVTSIGDFAFMTYTGLTSVRIPDSVISIGKQAFMLCLGLTSVDMGNGVTSIDYFAFWKNENLTSISIPNSVTSIGYSAFHECHNLKYVYYGGSEKEWEDISIESDNDYLTLDAEIYYTPTKFAETPTISVRNGIYTVSTELQDIDSSCMMIVTLLKGRKMTDFKIINLSVGQTEASVELTADVADTVKVFVWDNLESINPLCKAKTITIK